MIGDIVECIQNPSAESCIENQKVGDKFKIKYETYNGLCFDGDKSCKHTEWSGISSCYSKIRFKKVEEDVIKVGDWVKIKTVTKEAKVGLYTFCQPGDEYSHLVGKVFKVAKVSENGPFSVADGSRSKDCFELCGEAEEFYWHPSWLEKVDGPEPVSAKEPKIFVVGQKVRIKNTGEGVVIYVNTNYVNVKKDSTGIIQTFSREDIDYVTNFNVGDKVTVVGKFWYNNPDSNWSGTGVVNKIEVNKINKSIHVVMDKHGCIGGFGPQELALMAPISSTKTVDDSVSKPIIKPEKDNDMDKKNEIKNEIKFTAKGIEESVNKLKPIVDKWTNEYRPGWWRSKVHIEKMAKAEANVLDRIIRRKKRMDVIYWFGIATLVASIAGAIITLATSHVIR